MKKIRERFVTGMNDRSQAAVKSGSANSSYHKGIKKSIEGDRYARQFCESYISLTFQDYTNIINRRDGYYEKDLQNKTKRNRS